MESVQSTQIAVADKTHSLADHLVLHLQQVGVKYIFGVPGGAIEPLFDALAKQSSHFNQPHESSNYLTSRRVHRNSPHIQLVIARHESAAAFMADGYTRETGNIAACCATTGPGTTNLITGVASAYADHVPMLVISAQTAMPNFGKKGLQESTTEGIDTVAMFSHCTKYSSLVSHPSQLAQKLSIAISKAVQHPQGPVHLSIPMDIMRSQFGSPDEVKSIAHLLRTPKVVDMQALDALSKITDGHSRYCLYLGSNCGKAASTIMQFAEQTNTPIITTPMGKRWISAFHPLNHGVFGFAGHYSSRALLAGPDIDYVLAVGTSMDELGTAGWDTELLMNQRLIHIDMSMDNFNRSSMAALHVFGDINMVFQTLLNQLKKKQNTTNIVPVNSYIPKPEIPANIRMVAPDSLVSNAIPLRPQRIMHFIAERFPDSSRVVCDAGNSWAWATHYLHLRSANRYHIGMGFGTMAWAIGASIGIALADRTNPVICVTGDGSYLMSSQEMTVAIQQHLNIIFIILNDQALGMVKHGQRLGGGEAIGFELPAVNFAAIATAMGASGYVLNTPEQLDELNIQSLCDRNGPVLLDIHIDPEEVPPMGARLKVLKND